jgi:RNA polymerase sigma-70 factor (ECF subfamily)
VSVSVDARALGDEFAQRADPYRRELLAHCYRMLGSLHDAEDVVQETLIRAWRGYEGFDGRSSIRTWLYRIATNACLTALQSRHHRVLPSGLATATDGSESTNLSRVDGVPWLGPIPSARVSERPDDPATIVAIRDSTRLALVAAFQRLPARQRAVLLLVEVVGYRTAEAAEFLDISAAAARSLLQRARATVAGEESADPRRADVAADDAVLGRYLAAFEAADTAAIAALLREDIAYEMPPVRTWFRGRAAVVDHLVRRVFNRARRSVATSANGYPAAATYVQDGKGAFVPHAIHVLETDGGSIARIVVFLDATMFPSFGLPTSLPATVAS